MKELIIGRNAVSGQLSVQYNGSTKSYGEKDSVYQSVGREHVKLSFEDSDEIMLTNMNIENDTFVNGRGVEQKYVQIGDKIELGGDRYLLNWEWLKPYIPVVADIRPLKKMWEDYEAKIESLNRLQIIINCGRATLGGGALSLIFRLMLASEENTYKYYLSCIAFVILVLLFLYSMFFITSVPKKRKQLENEMEKSYRCPQPKCGYIFFPTKYNKIQYKKCPGCGAILKK